MKSIKSKLAKLKKASEKIAPSEGIGSLPDGQYIGSIQNMEIKDVGDAEAMNASFQMKVTEGELAGRTGWINQNVVKKDGELNEIGTGIVKGILQKCLGKDVVPDNTPITEFEKLGKKAAGSTLKWTVSTPKDAQYSQQTVNAVMSDESAPTSEEDDDDDIPMGDAEEEETVEEEEAEEELTEEEVRKELKNMSRKELKEFNEQYSLGVKFIRGKSDKEMMERLVKAAVNSTD